MKTLFLGYSETKIIDFLKGEGENIVVEDQKLNLKEIQKIDPDHIVSYGYRHIITPDIIEKYPDIVNLHVSYLPYNKGCDPNFWSWLENTPKGYTIHYIDQGIDTGDILIQEQGIFTEDETLATSYDKLRTGIENLFITNWENLSNKKINPKKQNPLEGNHHYSKDLKKYEFLLEKEKWDTPVIELKKYGKINDLWRTK